MPTDTRTPQQQWDDLFRPPATKVVLFAGRLYEIGDDGRPGRRLPPEEERRRLEALNR